jgi:hypothetical protein
MQWQQDYTLNKDEVENHRMGLLGVRHIISLPDKKTFIRSSISATYLYDRWDIGGLEHAYERVQYIYYNYSYPSLKAATMVNHKFNAAHTIRAGIEFNNLYFDLYERRKDGNTGLNKTIVDKKGQTSLAETYLQWKYRFTENMELNSGLHALYFLFNKHYSLEPRIGLKWQFSKRYSFNYGFGIHSRIEPISCYVADVPSVDTIAELNKNVNFTRAVHNVIGYDLSVSSNLRLKAEAYYQYLFDVPIHDNPSSTWSALNARYGIPDSALSNKGKGYNMGVELTLEKFYTNNYYYLITLSLYDSKYRAGNNKLYNTYYNGNYVANWLFGKDFRLGTNKQNIFGINVKSLIRGGLRYPEYLWKENNKPVDPYSKQMPYYLRFDLGLKYRKNNPGYSWMVSLDIQNVTNRQNITGYDLNNWTNSFYPSEFGLGIVPILNLKIEF